MEAARKMSAIASAKVIDEHGRCTDVFMVLRSGERGMEVLKHLRHANASENTNSRTTPPPLSCSRISLRRRGVGGISEN